MAQIKSIGLNPLNIEEISEFTIEVDDQLMYDVVQAICKKFDYQAIIDGEQNPEGPGTFAWRMTIEWWKFILYDYYLSEEEKNIRQSINEQIKEKMSQIVLGIEE